MKALAHMYVRTFIQHTMCIVQSYVTEEVSNSVTHVRICKSVVIKKAVTLMYVLSTQLHVCMYLYTYREATISLSFTSARTLPPHVTDHVEAQLYCRSYGELHKMVLLPHSLGL